MNFFRRNRQNERREVEEPEELHPFDPSNVFKYLGMSRTLYVSDLLTGTFVSGATGSGKSTGPGKALAYGFLCSPARMGGVVACVKPDEAQTWIDWATECGREDHLSIIDSTAIHCCNVFDHEAKRSREEGGALAQNIVGMMNELQSTIGGEEGKNGGDRYWRDSQSNLSFNIVQLVIMAGLDLTFPLMLALVNSIPRSIAEAKTDEWKENSVCGAALMAADENTKDGDPEIRADFEAVRNYITLNLAGLAEKTRSIITGMFETMAQPFATSPFRQLFGTETSIHPEDCFDSKIIIVDLPILDWGNAGRLAQTLIKLAFQKAVLRRKKPKGGLLRPVFFFADECQYIVSENDHLFQSVCRSAACCVVYMTQSKSILRSVLGDDDKTEALLGNLQLKIWCMNSGETCEWSSKLLGERYVSIRTANQGLSFNHHGENGGGSGINEGESWKEEKRPFIEPAEFLSLRKGGPKNGYKVDCILFNGGELYAAEDAEGRVEMRPFTKVTFDQLH